MTASLFSFGNSGNGFEGPQDESIGSAGSLAHRSQDEDEDEGEEGDSGAEFMPVAIFLAGLGMQVFVDWAFEQLFLFLTEKMLLKIDQQINKNLLKHKN